MEPTQNIPPTPAIGSTAFPDIVFTALRALAAGSADRPENSLFNFRKSFADHIVSGLNIAKTGNLTTSSGGGIVIIDGAYVTIAAEGTFQYQVSSETYNLLDSEGNRTRVVRQPGQTSPVIQPGFFLHSRVVTDQNAIERIDLTGTDSNGELIHNRAPVSKQQVSPLVGLPTGVYLPYAGTRENVPDGWLIADGRAVSRTNYQTLFQTIGTQYGPGDGANTFNLPLGPGRIPVNVDESQTMGTYFNAIGKNTGQTEVGLDWRHNGPHSHYVNDPGHSHGYQTPYNIQLTHYGQYARVAWEGTRELGRRTSHEGTGIWLNNDGQGLPHLNIQPSQATLYIIKT